MNIGEKIKLFRNEKGLTQDELASKCGLSKNGLWNYENNKRQPSIETLEKIAVALDKPLVDLIGMDKLLHFEQNISEIDKAIISEFIKTPPENYMYSPSELEKKNKEKMLNSIKEISKLSDITIKQTYTDGILVGWEETEEGKFPIYDDAGLFGGIEVTYKNKSFTLTAEEYYKLANKIIESVATNILATKAEKE